MVSCFLPYFTEYLDISSRSQLVPSNISDNGLSKRKWSEATACLTLNTHFQTRLLVKRKYFWHFACRSRLHHTTLFFCLHHTYVTAATLIHIFWKFPLGAGISSRLDFLSQLSHWTVTHELTNQQQSAVYCTAVQCVQYNTIYIRCTHFRCERISRLISVFIDNMYVECR